MNPPNDGRKKKVYASIGILSGVAFASFMYAGIGEGGRVQGETDAEAPIEQPRPPELDREAYDRKLRQLAHLDASASGTVSASSTAVMALAGGNADLWPAKASYPNVSALLPFNRIVAYYGNFYAKGMGVLGEYSTDVVIEKLDKEVKRWEEADPTTPVIRAIDYIAIVAQAGAGKDGKYRARMPTTEIDKAVALAERVDGIVILEVQAGLANLMGEVRSLETYLKMPQVHLAIDPEFRMKTGARPGTRVGTVDATDVNEAAEYLAMLVKANNLPPKILVVHRYTRPMVTNATKIVPLPEVQVVVDMDGWGSRGAKLHTYTAYVASEPVQFTGFKLFYKNDIKWAGARLWTPKEILDLTPRPSFIQYQ